MRLLCEARLRRPALPPLRRRPPVRDFTYVADAVDATVRAARADDPATIYNVGGGEEATMGRVIDLVAELSGREVPVDRVGVQRGDVRRTCADTTRARRGLDWHPETGLREGLAAQVAWVRGLWRPAWPP